MKRLVLLAALVIGGCSKQPPPPTPAEKVFSTLVQAKCLANTEDGLAAVQKEAMSDRTPDWFNCLWNGGTVATCGGCPK